jgi:hypothetical protein
MAALDRLDALKGRFGYMPDTEIARIFFEKSQKQQKLTVIDERLFRELAQQAPLGPPKTIALKDGARWKTQEEYLPRSGEVLSCHAAAFTRFVKLGDGAVALLTVDMKKRDNDQAMGANLQLLLRMKELLEGDLDLDLGTETRETLATADELAALERWMLPGQGFQVSVVYEEAAGGEGSFRLAGPMRLLWCADQQEARASWGGGGGGRAPDLLHGLLVGRKLLPLVSQEAQLGTVAAVNAKAVRSNQHHLGRQRVCVSVFALEHLLKATLDLERAAEACGVAEPDHLGRRNVFAKVFSQYHRHVNDERELFAEVARLGSGEAAYLPDWDSAPLDTLYLPWKAKEEPGQVIDLEAALSPEQRLLQRQLLEILGGHIRDKRTVIKRELQRDEKVAACCLLPCEPTEEAAADVPDYTRSYRQRAPEHVQAPPSFAPKGGVKRRERSKSVVSRRPAARRQRQSERRQWQQQPERRHWQQQQQQPERRHWQQQRPERDDAAAACVPLGVLREEARFVPAVLRDLRCRLTEQAAKSAFQPTEAVMQLVRSIPHQGLTPVLAALIAAGYDVADMAAFEEGAAISAEHVEVAFQDFQVHYYWDGRDQAFYSPPTADESLYFARLACCVVAWLSYLRQPWVELLLLTLEPVHTGTYAARCAVDPCLNPHVHGFDLELLRCVARLGGGRDAKCDMVAYNYFRAVLDDLVKRHWSVGHSQTSVGLNAYSVMVGASWAVQRADSRGGRIDETRLFRDLKRLARVSQTLKNEVSQLCGSYQRLRADGYQDLPAELLEELRAPGYFPEGEHYAQSTEAHMAPVCVAAAPWPW